MTKNYKMFSIMIDNEFLLSHHTLIFLVARFCIINNKHIKVNVHIFILMNS